MLDVRGAFAVKRPLPAYQHHVGRAVAYCRDAYDSQVPFDRDLKMGDDQPYCIELTQRAYAANAQVLQAGDQLMAIANGLKR